MTIELTRRIGPRQGTPTGIRRRRTELPSHGLASVADWRRPRVRFGLTALQAVVMVVVALGGAGPLLWILKGALTDTQELLRHPLALWPDRPNWANLSEAWTTLEIGRYLANTVVLVAGSWFVHLLVATTAGYALSVLRPWYGKYVDAAIMATLFVPGTVTLVGLYLTVLDLPITGGSIVDTPFAVWLPSGASAFTILLVKRFFDAIPRELYEAAEVDGAGTWAIFRLIVLPMSLPILTVVSLLTVIASWKDFLWPLIAIGDPSRQPLAVALPRLAQGAEESLLLAGMVIATVPPVIVLLLFQRHIVKGVGFTGLKG